MASETGVEEAGWPTERQAWSSLAVLLLAYTLSFADRMVMNLLIEPIKKSLQISDTQVSMLVGFAFATFYVLLGMPAGYIADRINRKKMIASGLIGWSLMTGVCGMAGSFATLFMGRMGVGVGEATLGPAAYSIISDTFPREKIGRAASIYASGVPLGTGAALMLGGLLISKLTAKPMIDVPLLGMIESWRAVFLILAMIGVPIALLMLAIREPLRRDQRADAPATTVKDTVRFIRSRKPVLIFYLSATAFMSCANNGVMTWIPTFLVRTYPVATGDAGFYYGMVFAVFGLAGLLVGGILSDHLIRRGHTDAHLRGTLFAAMLAIPFMVLFPLAPTFGIALLLLAPLTVAMAMPMGISLVVMQLMSPGQYRGQMTSVFFIFSSLIGYGMGPMIYALVTDQIFHDPLMLRYSLSIVSGVTVPIAVVLYWLSLKPYRECLASMTVAQSRPEPL